MTRTNAVTATNNFIKAFSHPEQFYNILQHTVSPVPTQNNMRYFINAVLTVKPNLLIDSSGVTLFGLDVPFKSLFKETLQELQHLLTFQRNRRTLFNDCITQVYSIRYFNFSLNTFIDAVVPRDKLFATVIRFFGDVDQQSTREYVISLRTQNSHNFSLLKFFDILLK